MSIPGTTNRGSEHDAPQNERARKRQRTGSLGVEDMSALAASLLVATNTPAAALHRLPAELLQRIAALVAFSHGLPAFFALKATSRHVYAHLDTPGSMGTVFAAVYDTTAAGRRILQFNPGLKRTLHLQDAHFDTQRISGPGSDSEADSSNCDAWRGGVNHLGMASQFASYTNIIGFLNSNNGQPSVYHIDADAVLTTAFVMLMEDDSYDERFEDSTVNGGTTKTPSHYGNGARLRDAGLRDFAKRWVRSRLWEGRTQSNGWPQVGKTASFAIWVLWMTIDEEMMERETEMDKMEIIELILPYVMVTYRYPLAYAPSNHFHLPLKSQDVVRRQMTTVRTAHGPFPLYPSARDRQYEDDEDFDNFDIPGPNQNAVGDDNDVEMDSIHTDLPGSRSLDAEEDEDLTQEPAQVGSELSNALLARAGITIQPDGAGLTIDKRARGTGGETVDFRQVGAVLYAAGYFGSSSLYPNQHSDRMKKLYGNLFQHRLSAEPASRNPTQVWQMVFPAHFVAPPAEVESTRRGNEAHRFERSRSNSPTTLSRESSSSPPPSNSSSGAASPRMAVHPEYTDGDIKVVAGFMTIPARLIYFAYRETQKFSVPPHLPKSRIDRALKAVDFAEQDGHFADNPTEPARLRTLLNTTSTPMSTTVPIDQANARGGLRAHEIVYSSHSVDLGVATLNDVGPTKEDLDEFSAFRGARLVPKYSSLEPPSLTSPEDITAWNAPKVGPPTSYRASNHPRPPYILAAKSNEGFDQYPSERWDNDWVRWTGLSDVDVRKPREEVVGRLWGEPVVWSGEQSPVASSSTTSLSSTSRVMGASSSVPRYVSPSKPRGNYDLPLGAWGVRESTHGRTIRRTCYTVGSLTGLWEGRMLYPEHGQHHRLITEANYPPNYSEGMYAVQATALYFNLQEHVHVGAYHRSHDEDDIEASRTSSRGLVDDNLINGWFPIGSRMEKMAGYVTIHPPTPSVSIPEGLHPSKVFLSSHGQSSADAVTYETYVPGQPIRALNDVVDSHNPNICATCLARAQFPSVGLGWDDEEVDSEDGRPGVVDVIVTGESERRHGDAWSHWCYYGRVRRWDGLIGILRVPSGPEGQHRPQFFYGYIIGGQNFVGTWREANASLDTPPWEGPFVIARRDG